jgi:hypothetical protein
MPQERNVKTKYETFITWLVLSLCGLLLLIGVVRGAIEKG